jgi:hypothetical protein
LELEWEEAELDRTRLERGCLVESEEKECEIGWGKETLVELEGICDTREKGRKGAKIREHWAVNLLIKDIYFS